MNHRTILAGCIALTAGALAQTPSPPVAKGDAVINGNFAKFTAQENLWDGVDAQSFLAGRAVGAYAVTESGKVGSLQMPITVHFTDMNGDKHPDIVSCDPAGVVRVYFNSGTPAEPKFTTAEVVPIFPPQVAKDKRWHRRGYLLAVATQNPEDDPLRLAQTRRAEPRLRKLHRRRFDGGILMVENTGSTAEPVFPQPNRYASAGVQVGSKRWGNLFALCV